MHAYTLHTHATHSQLECLITNLSQDVELHIEHFPSVVTPDRSHHKFIIPWIQVSVGHWTLTLNN